MLIRKKCLLRGEVGSIVAEINTLIGPRQTKEQTTSLNDFITHGLTHRRADDSGTRSTETPIGREIIESAVRRVINLRAESNAGDR